MEEGRRHSSGGQDDHSRRLVFKENPNIGGIGKMSEYA